MLPLQGKDYSGASSPSGLVVSKGQDIEAWSKHVWPAELALFKITLTVIH